MTRRQSILVVAASFFVALLGAPAVGGDWPTWRYDAGRTAVSPERLPDALRLAWMRRLAPPAPAWPASQTKLRFDASYEPIVVGKRIVVPSMTADRVTAYDTDTGEERWRFYTDGPVRFAPAAWQGKVYVACDDGYLYCLDAAGGDLVWKFRGGPSDRRVLGNDRLISSWPARGAPVVADGTVYFAAGIWPFMGTFIHALDAETGQVRWTNSGSGSTYITQQHNSAAFAGVAPQGYLAVAGDKLLVSGGRTVPAAYDRRTGEYLYFHVSSRQFGKDAGGYEVVVAGDGFLNGGAMYRARDGAGVLATDAMLAARETFIGLAGRHLVGYALKPQTESHTDSAGKKTQRTLLRRVWKAALDVPLQRLFIEAGGRAYGEGRDGLVAAVNVADEDSRGRVAWQGRVEGSVWTMLAADGKLFVVTRDGSLYCFGPDKRAPAVHLYEPRPLAVQADRWTDEAEAILDETGARGGYALVLGIGSGRLVEELVRRTDLHVIAVDPDAEKVASLRLRMDAAGLYGRRVSAHAGDPVAFAFPPYLASLVVSEDLKAAGLKRGSAFVKALLRALRPYDGTACLATGRKEHGRIKGWLAEADLAGADLDREGGFSVLTRGGPLPGAGSWTHQYADVANTTVSQEARVRVPLGLLWFGGPANDPVLPRHGHGPTPQVVGGRVLIEGRDMLRAVDVYTGRLLWQRDLKDVGLYYDNTLHQPGANEVGSNYVSVEDGIYVAYGRECLRLDPKTGQTRSTFRLPDDAALRGARFGYLGVYEDLLIATACPIGVDLVEYKDADGKTQVADVGLAWNARYGAGSRWILVMDRTSGKVLWKRQAAANFRHNTIVAGGGKVFCIDGLTAARLTALRFRGREPEADPVLYALDARTGDVAWRADEDVFGTWLAYSQAHDVLLEAGSGARDRALDEATDALAVYRGTDGRRLWQTDKPYEGPCMIHGDTIITQAEAFGLMTGQRKRRTHPITGETIDWTYARNYGCNTSIAGRNLILFRSAAAGYYDLARDGGTGNLGGFKSGCTSNLIAADGVLSAPDYTRTCTCSYQNQCSLAFIHDPDVETWTFNSLKTKRTRVRRLGVNFGAPGDRLADDGTLWLEWPIVGGSSPRLTVKAKPAKPRTFRQHMAYVEAGELKWVAASGLEGVESLTIRLDEKAADPRPYTVRLHFAEPGDAKAGDRVFSVGLQGKTMLEDFDIVAETGGPRRALVREFKGVEAAKDLTVDFEPKAGQPLLCGIEVIAE